jgi:hypothetical protein
MMDTKNVAYTYELNWIAVLNLTLNSMRYSGFLCRCWLVGWLIDWAMNELRWISWSVRMRIWRYEEKYNVTETPVLRLKPSWFWLLHPSADIMMNGFCEMRRWGPRRLRWLIMNGMLNDGWWMGWRNTMPCEMRTVVRCVLIVTINVKKIRDERWRQQKMKRTNLQRLQNE